MDQFKDFNSTDWAIYRDALSIAAIAIGKSELINRTDKSFTGSEIVRMAYGMAITEKQMRGEYPLSGEIKMPEGEGA